MNPRRLAPALVAAFVGACGLPANAFAVDHVSLTLQPSALAGKPGWYLLGHTSDTGGETFGLTLQRSFSNGLAEERHAFRGRPQVPTLSFDGRAGRWDTRRQFGQAVTTRMTITATGTPEPVADVLGCRGAFVRVPVTLRGTFVVRTRTRFFGTIRRSRLNASVTFNQGGPVDCTPAASADCAVRNDFSVTRGNQTTVLAGLDTGGWLTLSFAESIRRVPATWYHVMLASGFHPFAGQLPAIGVRIPSALAIVGGGTFTPGQASESTSGSCRTTTTSGTFTGTFRATFRGWGRKAVAFRGDRAQLREVR